MAMLKEQKNPKWRIVQQPPDTILKLKGCHNFVEKKTPKYNLCKKNKWFYILMMWYFI